jgi:hypothetical protein
MQVCILTYRMEEVSLSSLVAVSGGFEQTKTNINMDPFRKFRKTQMFETEL